LSAYLLLCLAVLPGLLLSYAVFRADKYERESAAALMLCFGLGAAATLPAIAIEKWICPDSGLEKLSLWKMSFFAFGAVAFNEEFFKLLALLVGAFPWRFFNEPMDGIVYAVLVAMGFATAENVLYFDRFGAEPLLLRAFTAVPAHLVFGIVVGYFAGLAKFTPDNKSRLLLFGFGLAVLIHGLYDLLILQKSSDWLTVLASVALYLCLFYCGELVKVHQHNSPFRKNRDDE
jgi:RsiW-degrading membrane proteinase PrsW (M82 family)